MYYATAGKSVWVYVHDTSVGKTSLKHTKKRGKIFSEKMTTDITVANL